MLKRALLSVVATIIFLSFSFAQGAEFTAKLNVGVGLDYKSLDYDGTDVYYSAGGGMGVELGLIFPFNQFETFLTAGYQQNLALQYESSTYGTNESSFHFNRKTLNCGANYKFYFSDGKFRGVKFGGGVGYNFPGRYKVVENNTDFGDIHYSPSLGYFFNVDFVFQFREFSLVPGLRYRSVSFNVDSFENGRPEDLSPDLRELNANGIDISVSIIKKIN